ncbi:hypothetical protein cypCar_00022993 [Cyprinus carpio]|nr:hypothetical protein cypCar_00022993 [Cyprinus carpio]
MVLEWTRPGLSSPLRPICDLRVLDHFIKEAWDAEAAMRACKDACSIATNFTVPLTRVDFDVWEAMNEYVPPTSGGEDKEMQIVSSISELFQVHINFLRGKVRLLTRSAPICHQGVS